MTPLYKLQADLTELCESQEGYARMAVAERHPAAARYAARAEAYAFAASMVADLRNDKAARDKLDSRAWDNFRLAQNVEQANGFVPTCVVPPAA